MLYKIMSREKARCYSFQKNIPRSLIISISDADEPDNCFAQNPQIVGILRLNFDDVEKGSANCMTKSDGGKIVAFLNQYLTGKNDIEQIVVHCGAGVSRSAGVCAAIMCILDGDDSPVFNGSRFCPNMTCYRIVLETYFERYDEVEVDEKLKRNIEAWKKVNL